MTTRYLPLGTGDPGSLATYPARRSSPYGQYGEAEERFDFSSTERCMSFLCLTCRLEAAPPPVSLTLWMTFARWPFRRELSSLTRSSRQVQRTSCRPSRRSRATLRSDSQNRRFSIHWKCNKQRHMTSQSHRHQGRGGPDAGHQVAGWMLESDTMLPVKEGSHYCNKVTVAPYFRPAPLLPVPFPHHMTTHLSS